MGVTVRFHEIGVKVLEIGELKITLSEEDQARVDELQDQMAAAKLKAYGQGRIPRPRRAQQKQLASTSSSSRTRATCSNRGRSFGNYAAGRAMIGAARNGAGRRDRARRPGADGRRHRHAGMMQQQMQAQQIRRSRWRSRRRERRRERRVPKCAAQVPRGKFCQECGGPLAPRRGSALMRSGLSAAKFCANCGTPAPKAEQMRASV